MSIRLRLRLLPWLLLLVVVGPATASPRLTVQTFENNDADFGRFAEQVNASLPRNLLARSGTRIDETVGVGDPSALTDGDAGTRGEHGRCFVGGHPTVLTYYLGGPKTIHQVGLYSFNVDTRSNQDFEVRFADSSKHAGARPSFAGSPVFGSGNKVVGHDRGGVYSTITDSEGKPLAQHVDWVEFRLWATHTAKAGEPSHRETRGAAVYVELEVRGPENDLVKPTAEELAYRELLRLTPRQPEYVKQATWQETLIANRERLFAWEAAQDQLALRGFGLQLGTWHALGPIDARSPVVAQVRRQTRIDFHAKIAVKPGLELTWQPRTELVDGRIHQLGAGSGQVWLLAREFSLTRAVSKRQLDLDITADRGTARILPSGQGLRVFSPVGFSRGGAELTLPAEAGQILLEVQAAGDGQNRFYFSPQPSAHRPGAGDAHARIARRAQLLARVRDEFAEEIDQTQLAWETRDQFWTLPNERREVKDWLPGHSEAFLQQNYRLAIGKNATAVARLAADETGLTGPALAMHRSALLSWAARWQRPLPADLATAGLRDRYYALKTLQELLSRAIELESTRLAIEDHRGVFADKYRRGAEYLGQVAALRKEVHGWLDRMLSDDVAAAPAGLALSQRVGKTRQAILLDTPLLAFDKLLLVKGHTSFASNWTGPNHLGQEIVALSPVRPDGKLSTLYRGNVSDMDLHWNADRLLFSDGRALWEIKLDGSGLRRVSAEEPPVSHYDACYLPDGQIACISNACEQAVPCTGGGDVGNLHLLSSDGKSDRRVTFDQDHDWNPTVLNDGRVLYTRWEYTDLPHYFSRILFSMNPDGTGQTAYYGSNSYWPNAMYWPRPIPGHPTQLVCVVSGHHGVSRVGELALLDPARGRHEADGALQRIPGYGKKVTAIIRDNLVGEVWPRFAAPWPLAESGTQRGAGKYFLACVQRHEQAAWDVCLVDVFDNITPLLTGGFMTPIPVVARPMPPVIPPRIDLAKKDAVIYMANVYEGGGLQGYPRGSIKALRVGTHQYRYPGNGDTYASSLEGGWDVKRILGTVPVEEDGSALFRVPANTPIFVQPLDGEGKSQQQMRSWYTAMPGEVASCVGCHESANAVPPGYRSLAASHPPKSIEPWLGPERGFSFDREVQPLLDRRCVGCHDGQAGKVGEVACASPDLRAKQLHPEYTDRYSPAYVELLRYVRRAGYESDNHMHAPAEFDADTSVLVQMLKKGHYGVTLNAEEWARLYTWIDYNIPYPANWRESHRPPRDEQVARRAEYKKRFASVDDHSEDPLPPVPVARFEPPRQTSTRAQAVAVANWPMPIDEAQRRQKAGPAREMELALADGVAMKFVFIPAGEFVMGDANGFTDEQATSAVRIERPFYLGSLEVTNAQFACFDARHDSAYIEGRGKDRTTRGFAVNQPNQPVVRVSWNQAMAFCEWLSQKSGRNCTLPTEAQWEWACRAGTATRFAFGDGPTGKASPANLADESIARWNYGRCEPGYQDGVPYSGPGGKFAPSPWGLYDMHGNVAEWCRSVYRSYPYSAGDGRDDARTPGLKVVRGGSWNDTLRYATSASRWRYPPYQPVYNVGFRVLCEVDSNGRLTAAAR